MTMAFSGDASLSYARQFIDSIDVRFDVEIRILGAGDGQGGADKVDSFIGELGADLAKKASQSPAWPRLPMRSC